MLPRADHRQAARSPSCAPSSAAAPSTEPVPGVPPGLVGQALRFGAIGVLSTLAYLVLFLMLRGRRQRPAGQPAGAADHRGGQHRRQPPDHLRHPRLGRCGASTVPGADRLRARPGAHQRLARSCCTRPPPAPAGTSSSPCSCWPTRCPRCSASSCSAAGCSGRGARSGPGRRGGSRTDRVTPPLPDEARGPRAGRCVRVAAVSAGPDDAR